MAVGVTQELFTAEHYDTVLETMQQIEALFASMPRTRQTWGIIHADLGPGNWVLAPGADGRDGTAVRQPVPIDWCFCGYGPYLFDVGGTVPGLRPELRRLYLDGYQQEAGPLTAAELRFCDACFVLSVLGAAGFHISNPASHEWIARRMPWWRASTGRFSPASRRLTRTNKLVRRPGHRISHLRTPMSRIHRSIWAGMSIPWAALRASPARSALVRGLLGPPPERRCQPLHPRGSAGGCMPSCSSRSIPGC